MRTLMALAGRRYSLLWRRCSMRSFSAATKALFFTTLTG